jgi:hypothetical protein
MASPARFFLDEATPSKYGSSYINLSLDAAQALFTRQVPYFAEVVGMVGSPAIGSAQWTLDGRILSEDELEEAMDELSRIPCGKRCLLALEEECRCRCGGRNHGLWVKSAGRDASLEAFNSESGPVMSHDITRGKLELLMLARREVAGIYAGLPSGREV